MSDAKYSNRATTPGRGRFGEAIAELDRQRALPAGHPEVLQAFASGRPRLIVPPTMTKAEVDELVELGRQGLADELAEGLRELDARAVEPEKASEP